MGLHFTSNTRLLKDTHGLYGHWSHVLQGLENILDFRGVADLFEDRIKVVQIVADLVDGYVQRHRQCLVVLFKRVFLEEVADLVARFEEILVASVYGDRGVSAATPS
ncbi:hypothetical protein PI125_g24521 [Phytophthora idaei]|nr:hypothetical protein PI125_g24521 [Phytophthora idaei]KAG3129857.1 hypothetical protein PI126_g20757 [Phytophthora idaei]